MRDLPKLPFFILGPCSIENEEFAHTMAKKISEITQRLGIPFIFKASYDKANRTSIDSFRGVGIGEGLRILSEIGKRFDIPVTTDVHSPEQAEMAAEYVDLLQIPAFLCRQTDLLVAAAKTTLPVNVKKGQFLSPMEVIPIVEKLQSQGCKKFFITERGSTFGYQNLVVDMRSIYWIRKEGIPVIFDATHSVQRPANQGKSTGGDSELAPILARAAAAVGTDGIFIETHLCPEKALSDGPNQIPLKDLEKTLRDIIKIQKCHDNTSS